MKIWAIAVILSVIVLASAKGSKGGRGSGRGRGLGSGKGFNGLVGRGLKKLPKFACKKFAAKNLTCSDLPNKPVCTEDGTEYFNKCEFLDKNCDAEQLPKLKRCDAETEDGQGRGFGRGRGGDRAKPTKPSKGFKPRGLFPNKAELCAIVENADCSNPKIPARKVCDTEGGVYNNICEFLQAKCSSPSVRPAKCPEEEGEEEEEEIPEVTEAPEIATTEDSLSVPEKDVSEDPKEP